MSILDHVVYANQQKKANQTGLRIPAIDKPKPAIKPVIKVEPVKGEHDRFKKLPGEKDQIKALKKQLKHHTTQKTYNAFNALTT